MNALLLRPIDCPYCGETIEVQIDTSAGKQNYIEDCQVCCRPIVMIIDVADSETVYLQAFHEDDHP